MARSNQNKSVTTSFKNDMDDIADNLGDDESPQQIRYSITSYGADHPVDGLVKRLEAEDILVPEFQRQYVWSLTQASRFIESLLLGLPVPGIFLSKEQDTRKLLVIDGQQRLLTLQYFYSGIFTPSGREFRLRAVKKDFENLTYKKLRDEDRRRLDDSIIHATIIQQEEPSHDDSSIYHIFERLNTGGTQLMPQEIRACVYHGTFNALLKELNSVKEWREIFGAVSKRMRDQELILRFLALYFMSKKYAPPMNEFLNNYMADNRQIDKNAQKRIQDIFVGTVRTVYHALGKTAFRPRRSLNAAVFDAVMVAIAKRQESGELTTSNSVRSAYEKLVGDNSFFNATEQGTATEEAVQKRLQLAIDAFSAVL